MNRPTRWGCVLALMPLVACASRPLSAPPLPPAPLASADASFIQTAGQGGMAEVQMAQLAEQTSKDAAVKAYAGRMIGDHAAHDDQLRQIVARKGAVMPSALSDAQQKTLTMLQGEQGARFDHEYAAAQVEGHDAMLSAFRTEAASGSDAELKSFASQGEPMIRQHLTAAQELAATAPRAAMHRHHHPKAS